MQKQLTPEQRRQLAAKHGVNVQYLYQCLTGRRDMKPAEAMRLETESDKELTRQMLCQKTYLGIWPDLAKANPLLEAQMAQAAKAGLIERRTAKQERREVNRVKDAKLAAFEAAGQGQGV